MKNHVIKYLLTALSVTAIAGFVACGGGGGGDTGTTSQQYQVSAAGGDFVYTSPDNSNIVVSLSFMAGAVSTDTTITVDSSSAVYDSNVIPGLGFEFSPDGLSFAGTVTFVVTYDETALGGADESDLEIHKWTSGQWQSLPSVVDTTANTVTANLSGFSEYYVFPEELQKLYYTADDGINGYSVWSWDGNEAVMEPDTSSSNVSLWPMMYQVFNDKLYFVMNSGQLWSYDGVQAGSVAELGNIGGAGGGNFGLLPFNDKLYFLGKETTTWELWSYNEQAGLTQETDTSGSTTYMPQGYMVYDGMIYFEGGDGSANRELYVFDGVNAPEVAAEINSTLTGSDPDWMTSFDGNLYIAADDGIHGRELWAYSSSPDSAYMVTDINPGSGDGIVIPGGIATDGANKFTPYNGKLYFSASSSNTEANHLWVTDGTALGTTLVADFTTCLNCFDADVDNLTVLDSKLYFYGIGNYDSANHNGLWVYDTADVVNTPMPVPGFGQGQYDLITYDGKLYFKGYDPSGFWGIMSSDGINEPVMEAYVSTDYTKSWGFFLGDSAVY